MKLAVLLVTILCIAGSCSYLNKKLGLPEDNQIEQNLEMIIEEKLGLPAGSVDLTPDNP